MIPRALAAPLQRLAGQYPVVTLTGPRQSGKTTLCRAAFPTFAYVNLEDPFTRERAISDPKGLLDEHPRELIIDEVQRAPQLPSYLQLAVDAGRGPFVITGSHQFEVIETVSQSLAGRAAVLRLLPFSLDELGSRLADQSVDAIMFRGFYPRIHDRELDPTEALSFYVTTYLERDLRTILQVRDLATFERFVRLCAANVGQLVNQSRLANDCGVDQKTVGGWLSVLQASYVLFLLQPHFRNYRKRLTKAPKLYFYDVGLAAYLLGLTQASQVAAHPLRGALFENLVVADVLKRRFNAAKQSNLYFFRDHRGNEVDLLLDEGTSTTVVEIKLGQTVNADYFKGLSYYASLANEQIRQFVVYGGSTDTRYREASVISYRNLGAIPV